MSSTRHVWNLHTSQTIYCAHVRSTSVRFLLELKLGIAPSIHSSISADNFLWSTVNTHRKAILHWLFPLVNTHRKDHRCTVSTVYKKNSQIYTKTDNQPPKSLLRSHETRVFLILNSTIHDKTQVTVLSCSGCSSSCIFYDSYAYTYPHRRLQAHGIAFVSISLEKEVPTLFREEKKTPKSLKLDICR